MAKTVKKDKYANVAYGTVTESAMNTLTFSQIETGISIFEKTAWVIHRILWYFSPTQIILLNAADDEIRMAFVLSSKITELMLGDVAVVDLVSLHLFIDGVPAASHMYEVPLIRDFTNLPGGGLIVPPRPVYLAVQGISLDTPLEISARIYFTHLDLSTEDYWELVEASRIVE